MLAWRSLAARVGSAGRHRRVPRAATEKFTCCWPGATRLSDSPAVALLLEPGRVQKILGAVDACVIGSTMSRSAQQGPGELVGRADDSGSRACWLTASRLVSRKIRGGLAATQSYSPSRTTEALCRSCGEVPSYIADGAVTVSVQAPWRGTKVQVAVLKQPGPDPS